MLVQHRQKEMHGIFFIEEDGEILAELTYSLAAPDNLIIEHTDVGEELQGRNIGYELVHHAVEYARTHNKKIVPVCPFAKAVFDKKPDFADVLSRL